VRTSKVGLNRKPRDALNTVSSWHTHGDRPPGPRPLDRPLVDGNCQTRGRGSILPANRPTDTNRPPGCQLTSTAVQTRRQKDDGWLASCWFDMAALLLASAAIHTTYTHNRRCIAFCRVPEVQAGEALLPGPPLEQLHSCRACIETPGRL
jgi:hypothetical protein